MCRYISSLWDYAAQCLLSGQGIGLNKGILLTPSYMRPQRNHCFYPSTFPWSTVEVTWQGFLLIDFFFVTNLIGPFGCIRIWAQSAENDSISLGKFLINFNKLGKTISDFRTPRYTGYIWPSNSVRIRNIQTFTFEGTPGSFS